MSCHCLCVFDTTVFVSESYSILRSPPRRHSLSAPPSEDYLVKRKAIEDAIDGILSDLYFSIYLSILNLSPRLSRFLWNAV